MRPSVGQAYRIYGKRLLAVCIFVAGIVSFAGGRAETVYKCVDADGHVTYQSTTCPRTQKQQTIQLENSAPSAAPNSPAAVFKPDPEPQPPQAPPPPSAPPPLLYGCVRATDGKSYVSDNGFPQPYLAPFGILGSVAAPLASVYGGANGAGASAPEISHNQPSSALIGSNYVWVQDQCRELSPREACQALQDQLDENAHKLRNAFQSQRAPFEQREADLKTQLAGC
jgi:Domain of unknown function (DUF4124)